MAALVLIAALLISGEAAAHAVGISKGDYTLVGMNLTAELTFARPEIATSSPRSTRTTTAPSTSGSSPPEARRSARASSKGSSSAATARPAKARSTSAKLTEQDGVVVRATYTCAGAASSASVEVKLLDSLSHGHRHIAHLAAFGGTKDDVLFRGHEEIDLHGDAAIATPSQGLGFFSFLWMGIEHILTGYDHLVFLFGLILVGGRTRALLGVVTAFTIGHSITLALAALNVYSPPSRVVEAGIALSIAYVGVENFFVKSAEGRWRITLPFGLVHGFGFASALREISLTRAQIPVALVSFNLGSRLGSSR